MKRILFLLIITLLAKTSFSQCNESLVEKAVAKNGTDAIFVRDFLVKLEEGNIKRPEPTIRYKVYLHKDAHYRFSVENDTEQEGKVIMQLYDRQNLLGSTYNVESNQDNQSFEYSCNKSGNYLVLMSFQKGKQGCAAGVMSMILKDSTFFIGDKVKRFNENGNILYKGIKNPLNIAATDIPNGYLDVSLNWGKISGKNGKYKVMFDSIGIATLTVKAKNKEGIIQETKSIDFLVKELPLPQVTIGGVSGGIINKNTIISTQSISLSYSYLKVDKMPYEIIEFSISDKMNDFDGYKSYSERLTMEQMKFLLGLEMGKTFYINEVFVKHSNGIIRKLNPVGFIIQ